jgi:hypothetical protein
MPARDSPTVSPPRLRDLRQIFEIIYGCDMKDASAFADMRGEGDGEFVKMGKAVWGCK